MLSAYQQEVQRIIFDRNQIMMRPGDLVSWINKARVQLAGEAECIRVAGSLALNAGTTIYPFSAVNLGSAPGVGGVFNLRTAWYRVASGAKWMRPRSFAWFSLYELNNPVPIPGAPVTWSQYGQGVAGTIYVSPPPDIGYTLNLDATCYPVALVDDNTPEAIPVPWTDAVPFFAAFYGYLSAQQMDAADKMYQIYETFMRRARTIATPSVLPGQYEQTENPFRANAIGAPGSSQSAASVPS